jgi:hypothetical protein
MSNYEKFNNSPASVQSLMNTGDANSAQSTFGKLVTHAKQLNHLDQTLTSILDSSLSAHCQVAEFRQSTIILVCSNASYATRIRMISPQLLESFKEEGGPGIERIEIRIAPVNRPQTEARKPKGLSPAALEALGRFASDSGDADIQAIFEEINARRNE